MLARKLLSLFRGSSRDNLSAAEGSRATHLGSDQPFSRDRVALLTPLPGDKLSLELPLQ